MSKTLLDRMRIEPWYPLFFDKAHPQWGQTALGAKSRATLIPFLADTVKFEITNVRTYLQNHPPAALREGRDLTDTVIAMPSFPQMWFEYEAQVLSHLHGTPRSTKVDQNDFMKIQVGWLVQAIDLLEKSEQTNSILRNLKLLKFPITEQSRYVLSMDQWQRNPVIPRNKQKHVITGPSFTVNLIVNADGRGYWHKIEPHLELSYAKGLALTGGKSPPMEDSDYDDVYSKLVPVLFALTFMNCKNVVHEKVKAPEALSRAHRKKWGERLISYHVLKVNPFNTTTVRHTEKGDHETTLPLHIVRGHFRIYTKERPMFGTYVGPVWVPAHTRGDEEVGTLVKDYEVVT